jgi:RNA polymerase sigma-70 factor (ECF subfamily)
LAQVYSYAFYELRDPHEAEDATARTFLSALANLGRFEERARPVDGVGTSTFRVWLFQIARNAVADRRRRQRRRPEAPLEAAGAVVAPIDIEGDATRHAEAAAAWNAVGRLPDDRRRALVLRFVDEMTTSEIAGVLGRSEGAVRVLIHRALRSLARDLDDPAG